MLAQRETFRIERNHGDGEIGKNRFEGRDDFVGLGGIIYDCFFDLDEAKFHTTNVDKCSSEGHADMQSNGLNPGKPELPGCQDLTIRLHYDLLRAFEMTTTVTINVRCQCAKGLMSDWHHSAGIVGGKY
jgi:hypothetical protein